MKSSNIAQDILTGKDQTIEFEDFLGGKLFTQKLFYVTSYSKIIIFNLKIMTHFFHQR
jgi:hypothetical protein